MAIRDITTEIFRSAWSNFATGVTIITTKENDDIVHGMTANGVASVSLEPPLALVIIGHERNTHPLIVKNLRFGISILSSQQQQIARHYTIPYEKRLKLDPPQTEALGDSRVISGALTTMDCRVVDSYNAGDHTIFIGQVENINIGKGTPLLYFHSSFTELKSTSTNA